MKEYVAGDELQTVPCETVPMGYLLVVYFGKVEQSDANLHCHQER